MLEKLNPAQKKKTLWALGISIIAIVLISLMALAGMTKRLELIAFDSMTRFIRGDLQGNPDVAVVLIDEASLKALNPLVGRWPWKRFIYADLLDFFNIGQPSAVAFDIMFSENEEFSSEGISDNDRYLAEATGMAGNVFHAQQIFRDVEDEYNKNLLGRDMPEDFRERFAVKGLEAEDEGPANIYYLPLPEIYDASYGMGVVEFSPDSDGVYRRTSPLRRYKKDFYPVMGLAPVIKKLGIMNISVSENMLSLDDIKVPLGDDGQYLINMYKNFNAYSISGVLASYQSIAEGDLENLIVDPMEFRDKIVYIGASAAGVEDMKPTSISGSLPGVYLHASFASNILSRDFLKPYNMSFTIFCIVLFAFAASFSTLFAGRMTVKIAVPATLLLLYIFFVVLGFSGNRLFALVSPSLSLVFSFVGSFVYLSVTEGKEKRKVRKMLGQYVSPHMLASLVDNREDILRAEVGSQENVTVLFSDIRGFTSISENEPPERIVSMLNQYFSLWSDAIFEFDGTIDKFVGDAVMALWGAPLRTEKHPEMAVRAALRMRKTLPRLNNRLKDEGYPEIRIGVGIHTGNAILGNIGSERKLDYTVIGDTVNLSSRIEGLTKQYSCDILVSEATYNRVSDIFGCDFVDSVKVKGKEQSVNIYKVNGFKSGR